MVRKIAMAFVPKDGTEVEKRSIYGMVCGFVGIFFNIILFVGKLLAGIITSSISITADALNNLSDAGSSIVTLAGFKLAAQKPDSKHPYGHGRIEYLAGLAVAAVILIMGFELFRDSTGKVLHPQDTEFSYVVIFILLASILVKCYMAYYNYSIGKEIDSAAVRAAAMDSMSDCIATGAVLVTTVLNHLYGWQLDGYCGILVSLFIMYSGIQAARDSVDPLLGIEPDEEFLQQIEDISLSFDENIVGIHDLMVHDYGPGRKIISLHAEVPADSNMIQIHDVIDNLEKKLSKDLGCMATIHMDPVAVNDPEVKELKHKVADLAKEVLDAITIHDFRVVKGDTHTNLIFDMVVPFSCKCTDREMADMVADKIKEKLGNNYYAVIDVDRANH
ncbi:MAG: cation diffusion facilitator family transporter [Lachnobacterium sp.]|nr:cation diffusion facilitator family transporter [Lachnobacterium sp.]MDD6632955.1 cation diffusion facilitator family transporter [Lachnobacterium sp.]